MAKAPVKRTKKNTNASSLITALQFISIAQKEKGSTYQTHCQIADNQIIAFDGTLSAGHYIEEDLTACPHTKTLERALLQCGENLSITKLDNERLVVKSGEFDVKVKCAVDAMPIIIPDAPIAIIDDRLKLGFEAVGMLAKEGAERVVLASVLLNAGSMIGTNGHVIIEFWHGIDLPPNLILPKSFVSAVIKSGKQLAQLGFSYDIAAQQYNSLTFHFADNSWLKTQLYNDQWPQVDIILNANSNAWVLPESFFAAVATLTPFSTNGRLYLFPGVLRSHADESEGASYAVEGLPGGRTFSAEYLKLLSSFAKCIDFTTYTDKAYFFGDNLRGALMACRS